MDDSSAQPSGRKGLRGFPGRPTFNFQVLYVFAVLSHVRRKILHFNVTATPSAHWAAQQLREAFPIASPPKYLLRDRDGIYGLDFQHMAHALGLEELHIAPRSPWQSPYVERLIGSLRPNNPSIRLRPHCCFQQPDRDHRTSPALQHKSHSCHPPDRVFANHSAYFTVSGRLWLWLLNSGAYMHWIWATPVWYCPRSWMRVEYSNT